jgi:hypothetical protein
LAFGDGMSLRQTIGRIVAAILIAGTAFVSVGLTAPADGLVTIRVRPSVINLAVDVHVKVGPKHFHVRWSALPEPPQPGCHENT